MKKILAVIFALAAFVAVADVEPIDTPTALTSLSEATTWGDIPADACIKDVVEGCGVKSTPDDYDQVKATMETALGDAEAAQAAANRILAYITGNTNVWFEVTNYYATASAPSLQLYEIRDGAKKCVWDQREWTRQEIGAELVPVNESIEVALNNNPARKWSKYQSVTGEENPNTDTTWISTPKISLSGGYDWEKVVTTAGSAWVLVNNGLIQEYGSNPDTTVGNAYFRIEDVEGNAIFEIKKTDAYLAGAIAGSVEVDGRTIIVHYGTIAATHPIAKICTSLEGTPVWYAETDTDCPASVVWSGESGDYTVRVTSNIDTAQVFMFAEYEVPGATLIEHTAPMSAAGGIMCTDGIHKCRPVYNNGSITWEVFQ